MGTGAVTGQGCPQSAKQPRRFSLRPDALVGSFEPNRCFGHLPAQHGSTPHHKGAVHFLYGLIHPEPLVCHGQATPHFSVCILDFLHGNEPPDDRIHHIRAATQYPIDGTLAVR